MVNLNYVVNIKLKYVIWLITVAVFTTLLNTYFLQQNYTKQKLPVILWWTPMTTEVNTKLHCQSGNTCIITTDKSLFHSNNNISTIIFYGSKINVDDFDFPLPKKDIPWGIYHEESPKNLPLFTYSKAQEVFQVTATFSRYSDFPITLQYLKNLDLITTNRYYLDVREKNSKLLNLAPVLYLQSDCETPINRDEYVLELGKYIQVDSYGICLNNKTLPDNLQRKGNVIDYYDEELMKFTAQYKFVVTIENSQCLDYVTEKFWRAISVGALPIYKGANNIKDWLPNNKSALLIDDFASIKQLAEEIHSINNNDDLYLSYMTHKTNKIVDNKLLLRQLKKGDYGISNNVNNEHPLALFQCFMCDQIYNNALLEKRRKIKNIYKCLWPENDSWDYKFEEGRKLSYKLYKLVLGEE